MHRKLLVFLTDNFPFGKGETFIENEISFLAESFEKIIIIPLNGVETQQRPVPENVEVIPFSQGYGIFSLLSSLKFTFNEIYSNELNQIRTTYDSKITLKHRQILLTALYNGDRIASLISKILKKEHYEDREIVVYSYWLNNGAIGCALLKAGHPGIKAIARAHRWDVYFEEHLAAYLPLRPFLYEHLDNIYAISDNAKNYLAQKLKLQNPEKIRISRLGTINQYDVQSESRRKERFLLVSCSSLIPRKRVELIVDALARVEVIQIEWRHLGDGPGREKIESLIREKLAGRNNIKAALEGSKSNREIYEFYNLHKPDLFINVSESEGIPVSVMEAMSFGIPAIATDVGGNSEIVNETNGVLLPPNPQADLIAQEIERLARLDSEARLQLRNSALEYWKVNYNALKNYTSFIKELQLP